MRKQNFETVSHAGQVRQSYNENIIPVEISEIRKKRKALIKENKIVELMRKYNFDRYAFSRLTDNKIFEYRPYKALFSGVCRRTI